MRPRSSVRISIAIATAAIWCAAIVLDPAAMERADSPVDGLVSMYLAWMVLGLMGALALLPFAWRRPKDWSHAIVLTSLLVTAGMASFHAIASLRHVPYRNIERLSTPIVCVQGLAILGCAVGILRLITLQPTAAN